MSRHFLDSSFLQERSFLAISDRLMMTTRMNLVRGHSTQLGPARIAQTEQSLVKKNIIMKKVPGTIRKL
jgi:hypothetical protein